MWVLAGESILFTNPFILPRKLQVKVNILNAILSTTKAFWSDLNLMSPVLEFFFLHNFVRFLFLSLKKFYSIVVVLRFCRNRQESGFKRCKNIK